MSIADLMQAMSDAGAPMEAILIAVRAIEEKDAQIEARRAGDRERKRRQRANSCDMGVTVTGPSRDKDGTVTDNPPALDKETSPTPPKEINPTPRARPARGRPDTRLAADWEPEPLIAGSPTERIVSAWQPGRLERELSKFRDHYRAAPGAKGLARDWQAKWRTWITNADQFSPTERRNGNRSHHDRPSGWAPRPGMEGAEPADLDF